MVGLGQTSIGWWWVVVRMGRAAGMSGVVGESNLQLEE